MSRSKPSSLPGSHFFLPLSYVLFTPSLPFRFTECWGHRGASAAFPENTLASFEAAMRDGSEGIESDVHVSRDDVVVMFHDSSLERTTDGKGLIRERDWYGPDGMEHVRTIKEPKQAIPTFAQTVELLMKASPENQHIKFNVDVKMDNEPTRLFSLMHKIISSQPDWETKLAPRILLGLWHPKFLLPAKEILPRCRRSHIGARPAIARKYFWDHVDAFSMWFPAMTTTDGQRFLADCKAANKDVMVWTVNEKEQMMEAARMGVAAILTDVPKVWLALRKELETDYEAVDRQYSRMFLWSQPKFYTVFHFALGRYAEWQLVSTGGELEATPAAKVA
ncbi:PLC-like phosphodiesterase [Vararia minispora EC-137]|uniref:PLC-like phosphodiesterase n=1 Tax=Vararia minispora EC-137 TaxID=1314806 RepID=A0ACB8QXX7_9AGAM|nr:PLC-like phosphodiesterase [Vararia minispora EC-137]